MMRIAPNGLIILKCKHSVNKTRLSRFFQIEKFSCAHFATAENRKPHEKLPSQARVVICGGGVVGTSVAYHLAKYGWNDVILIEQGRLGGGSTWHAAGLLGQLKQSSTETKLCQYSVNLYKEFEKHGLKTGWKQCGSLMLARTEDRMIYLKRLRGLAQFLKVECGLVSPEDIAKNYALLRTDDLKGGLWIPGDGVGDPYETCQVLASEAKKLGVKIYEGCEINQVWTHNEKVSGVETNKGAVSCEYFVNCAGFWARHIGRKSKPSVKVPLHPCEHYYLHTRTVDGLDPMMPVIRDYDGQVYFREYNGKFLAGGFEPIAKPIYHEGVPGTKEELQEDWDHFFVLLEQMLHRIPTLGDAVLERLYNSPECFTPDSKWILGESPEVKNYFVGTGMKTIGIVAAGGVGKVTAEWIIHGEPSVDVWQLDIKRFLGLHNNKRFLKDRMREVPGLHYKLQYPHLEFETGRNLRMSPLYPRLRAAGAVFGQTMGYERPAWFDSDADDLKKMEWNSPRIGYTSTFKKPPWFENMKSEYMACREGVGLLDYSSFTKMELKSKGTEVVDLLQYLCSNNVDIPVGSIIHTGMQNKKGGYENDCSLARIAENHYMMIAPTIQQTRCHSWIRRHISPYHTVSVNDVTSLYSAICVMGPLSRNLLTDVTDYDMSTANFPFFTFKDLNVCLASGIRVMNLTHTGEIGWVLYVPTEHALHVYDGLIEAGAKYNIKHVGYFAMRTLRIERFYAFWGQDLDTTTTPLECGRGFRVKFDYKGDFIGKDILLQQRANGVTKKYVQLILDNHDIETDPWPWGREPVYRNGEICGITSTTCFGFTHNKPVCLGYIQCLDKDGIPQIVTNNYILKGNYEVEIANKRFAAKINLHSPKLQATTDTERYMATRDELRAGSELI